MGNQCDTNWKSTVINIDIETGQVITQKIAESKYTLIKNEKRIVYGKYASRPTIEWSKLWRRKEWNQTTLF